MDIPEIRDYIGISRLLEGKANILGHRIKVDDVAIWQERMKMSPGEIIDQYPSINLAQVHASPCLYHGHRERDRGGHS